jgi:hypothetical protein
VVLALLEPVEETGAEDAALVVAADEAAEEEPPVEGAEPEAPPE